MIALDQSPATALSGSAGTTIAKAYSSAVPAGAFLICLVQWASTTATCTVADSVNGSWTAIGAPQRDVTNGLSTQVFYLASSGSGTPTVTATISVSVAFRAMHISSWTGQSGIEGTPAYNNGNATSAPAPSVTPAVSTDAVLAVCAPSDSVLSVGSPYTMLPNVGSGLGFAYLLSAGTSSTTPTFTKNGSGYYIGCSVVLAAAAGAVAAPSLTLLGVGA